jgi:hypothetical protein
MLFARNGFVFESTRPISAGFFVPRLLSGDRLRRRRSQSTGGHDTESIRLSAKAFMPVAAGIHSPTAGLSLTGLTG